MNEMKSIKARSIGSLAAFAWFGIIIGGLMVVLMQSGCGTVKGIGHLVYGIGDDIQTLGEGAERQLGNN